MQIYTQVILLFVITSTSSGCKLSTEIPPLSIVHGDPVQISEIPYQASLRYKIYDGWAHLCGATIISKRVVLTAAHCVISGTSIIDSSLFRVITRASFRASKGKRHRVSRIIVHERYDIETNENDISLVVTKKKITFSVSAQPIAIAPADLHLSVGTETLVSGYGATSFHGPPSSELRVAKVKIVDQNSCANAYSHIADISSVMICASASNPSRDSCQGDSGGPLVANGYIVGIVSFGQGCAHPRYPGVYTRVSEFNKWIEDNLSYI